MGEVWDIQDRAVVVLPAMDGDYDLAVMAMPYILRQRWLRCAKTLVTIKHLIKNGV